MSRSGYTDDYDSEGTGGLWRGAVMRSIRGKRGQQALKELAAAMDAMPVKSLAAESLVTEDGEFCTLGVLGSARGMDMSRIDPDDWEAVAAAFGIAPSMVREIVYWNDEGTRTYEWVDVVICGPMRHKWPHHEKHVRTVRVDIPYETVARQRWSHMRDWVQSNLKGAKHE
ncbi:hypothetical protein [Burkholderia arboris]|uniref:hypothetical protein n=1 Tax=Burkholderia arboris TaxID=488730 RepID=UPI001CF2FA91|nr:hypothetical protein [Burkholderia arboris]MCA8045527.1 hypothetical protein [Burkholderia arboris]